VNVSSVHADYDATAAAWQRARDVLAGEDAVKAGGERYLPRLDSQNDQEYSAYRCRASFFNATARTAEGFVGLTGLFELADERRGDIIGQPTRATFILVLCASFSQ
jgi:hypothetical protein